jgi:hypothetical protein
MFFFSVTVCMFSLRLAALPKVIVFSERLGSVKSSSVLFVPEIDQQKPYEGPAEVRPPGNIVAGAVAHRHAQFEGM